MMKNLFASILLSLLCCTPPILAADLNEVQVQGNVSIVEIIRTTGGTYIETYIHVWSDDGGLTMTPLILLCDADLGGDMASCASPSAFLGCSTNSKTHLLAEGIESTATTCAAPARKDSGECVLLTARINPKHAGRFGYPGGSWRSTQVLQFDVEAIGYPSDCSVKP